MRVLLKCLLVMLFFWGPGLAAKTTVLGENMAQRVIPFADQTGARIKGKRGQELIIDIISVLVTLFANSFALFRGV